MQLSDLIQWWNLPFVLPFALALVLLLLQAFGAFAAEHGFDGHADIGHGGHDAHLSHDAGHDAGHGPAHGHGHHGPHQQSHERFFGRALGLFGFGKAPLVVILMTFCFLWGFIGFASNTLLSRVLKTPVVYFWFSAFVALFLGTTLTSIFARLVGRLMPGTETQASRESLLVGCIGSTVFDVSETFGRVQVRDQYRNLQEVPCHTAEGAARIPANTNVVISHYDEEARTFTVRLPNESDPITTP